MRRRYAPMERLNTCTEVALPVNTDDYMCIQSHAKQIVKVDSCVTCHKDCLQHVKARLCCMTIPSLRLYDCAVWVQLSTARMHKHSR